jgi:hypothetical protein
LLADRALDVIAGIATEGSDDTDPFRERRRALFLFVVPATLFEFAPQSLNCGRLVAVTDDDHLPWFKIDFPAFNLVVDVTF